MFFILSRFRNACHDKIQIFPNHYPKFIRNSYETKLCEVKQVILLIFSTWAWDSKLTELDVFLQPRILPIFERYNCRWIGRHLLWESDLFIIHFTFSIHNSIRMLSFFMFVLLLRSEAELLINIVIRNHIQFSWYSPVSEVIQRTQLQYAEMLLWKRAFHRISSSNCRLIEPW